MTGFYRSGYVAVLLLAAVLLSSSHSLRLAVIGLSGAMAVGALVMPVFQRRMTAGSDGSVWGAVALHAALLSTLVLRVRTTDDLASSPLDAAAIWRILCMVIAVVAAFVASTRSEHRETARRALPPALFWYGCYAAVVVLGVFVAVSPGFVVFRAFELGSLTYIGMSLWRVFGDQPRILLNHVYGFIWALIATVVVGVFMFPGEAIATTRGGVWTTRIVGVFPALSANGVGTLGLLIFAGGLVRERKNRFWMVAGVLLVLASQYRTGYVALLMIVAVWMLYRYRAASLLALLALSVVVAAVLQSGFFVDAWQRDGSAESVETLSSRTIWWEQAFETVDRSPIIGTGLSSGTRFEAFEDLNNSETSTIHGTWVEVYLGTGLLGVLTLGLSLIAVARTAHRRAMAGDLLPILLLAGLLVRSLTGTTLELPGLLAIVFVALAAHPLPDGECPRPRARIRSGSLGPQSND